VTGPSVGIGRLAASADPGIVISAIGLGSCIGLVLADRYARVAGMVHVMLPDSAAAAAPGPPGKFADTAVPALLDEVCRLGADRTRLVGSIAGGATMFRSASGGGVLRIGERNEAAVRAAMRAAGLRVRGADTGGTSGRTLQVAVGSGDEVSVRVVGREAVVI